MILVELYTKDDCGLCDEARATLERVRQQIPFDLREIALAPGGHPYDEMIPVVHIDNVFALKAPIDEHSLRQRLEQISRGSVHSDHGADPP